MALEETSGRAFTWRWYTMAAAGQLGDTQTAEYIFQSCLHLQVFLLVNCAKPFICKRSTFITPTHA